MPSQVTGASQTALNLYQALYGKAPSYSLLADYKSTITTSGAATFASQMTAGFAKTSSATLASTVLNNLGVYTDALSAALTQMFDGYGVAARGQILLNITTLLSNLEGDTTYGAAATAFNTKIGNNFTYASDSSNTTSGVYTAPVTLDPTYSITTSAASVAEGGAGVVFTLSTTNVVAGTTFSYTITGTGDAAAQTTSGLFTVDGSGKAVSSAIAVPANTTYGDSGTLVLTLANGKATSSTVAVTDSTAAPAVTPLTFVLTTGVNAFTGSSTDDTFDAATSNSLSNGDVLVGGGGTDTLTAALSASTATVNSTSIEQFNITVAAAGGATLNMAGASGVTGISNLGSSNTLTLNNLASVPAVAINTNASTTTLNFGNAAMAGTNNLALNVDGVSGAAVIALTSAAGATNTIETVSLNSGSVANTINDLQTTGVGVTTLGITGDQNLTITTTLDSEIVTVSAGTATGGLSFSVGASAATVTTGSGADSVVATAGADTITTNAGADTITGNGGADSIRTGAGADLIYFASAAALNAAATVDGGDDSDTIDFAANATAGNDLIDSDLDKVLSVKTVNLAVTSGGAGANDVSATLAANASTAGIDTVVVGTTVSGDATTITSEVITTLNVNATAQNEGTLVLANGGTADTTQTNFVVTNADGAVTASSVTGTLSIAFKDDTSNNASSITTGTGNTSISGAGATDTITVTSNVAASGTLTLSGAAAITATSVIEDVAASASTGALSLTLVDTADNLQTVVVGTGNVILAGGGATDTVTVTGLATAAQTLTAASASSKFNITATTGAQSITGSAQADTISAGAGADTIVATAGNDVVTAGEDDDTFQMTDVLFEGTSGTTATFDGGTGTNTIAVTVASTGGVDADFRGVTNVQTLSLTGASTVVLGTNASTAGINKVVAGAGNTSITTTVISAVTVDATALSTTQAVTLAGTANYTVSAGTGNISSTATGTLDATFTDDAANAITVTVGTGAATLTGAGGTDTITVTDNSTSLTLSGVAKYDVTGASTDQTITGSTGDDTLEGAGGFDSLSGGAGNDVFQATYAEFTDGVLGSDTINGGTGTTDTLELTEVSGSIGPISLATVSNIDSLSITTTAAGTPVTSVITLNQATVTSLAGVDAFGITLADSTGGAGADDVLTLTASTVANALNVTVLQAAGGAGTVTVTTGSGADTVTGSANSGTYVLGSGNDTITGGTASDTITGGAGADSMAGGATGDNTYIFNTGDVASGEVVTFGGTNSETFSVATSTDFSLLNTGASALTGLDLLVLASGTTATFTASQLTGLTVAASTSAGTGVVVVNGTTAANTINLNGVTGTAVSFSITGGSGIDTITLGGGGDADTVVFSALTDGGATGDTVSAFLCADDTVAISGDLKTALDDVTANLTITWASAAGGAGAMSAANLSVSEALFVSSTENTTADTLTTLADIATLLNTEFSFTVATGDDALVVIEDATTDGLFGVYVYIEAGTSGVQSSELTLLGVITANAALTTADISFI